jgi:hypothetical protein
VKDAHVFGKTMTKNAGKMAKLIGCAFRFETEFMYPNRKLILQNVNSVIFTSLFNNRRMRYLVVIISQICIFL